MHYLQLLKTIFNRPLASLLIALCVSQTGNAQPNNDAYRDLLLFSEYGEFCSMCEAVLLCQQGDSIPQYKAIPDTDSFTLLHLETRTFWSQIATIQEWFMSIFSKQPICGHDRPVNIIVVAGQQWGPAQQASIHVDIEPPLLETDSQTIDRRQQQWFVGGKLQGYCQRLPLWESLEIIEKNVIGAANSEGNK